MHKILSGYVVESNDRKRLPGGPYPTRKAAEKRCAQINHMMHREHNKIKVLGKKRKRKLAPLSDQARYENELIHATPVYREMGKLNKSKTQE